MWRKISLFWRIFIVMLLPLLIGEWTAARAQDLKISKDLCFTVTDENKPLSAASQLTFQCTGMPADYQRKSLWLRGDASTIAALGNAPSLLVNMSRFEKLTVISRYGDKSEHIESVRRGDYGAHWRIGGQIKFELPDRSAPLQSVLLRFDRSTDADFLRIRVMPHGVASQQSASVAAIVACAMTLLMVSVVVSIALARAVGRKYFYWQAAWGTAMVLWGLCWSQANLAIFPTMAGTTSAQFASLLACWSMAMATVSAVNAPGRGAIPPLLKSAIMANAAIIAAGGVALSVILNRPLTGLDRGIGYFMLYDLVLIAMALLFAWRRGSHEGRDMLIGWSLPMVVLGLISLGNLDRYLLGGGPKLLMLVAATWQAMWMAGAVTRRLGLLRRERDEAQLSAERAMMLAERDPLTGLFNRRGFIERVTPMLEKARSEGAPAALLLVDIDRFKSVNDAFGHEVGDRVLAGVAQSLSYFEQQGCTIARIGGEEFALMAIGVDGMDLRRVAEEVRSRIGNVDHGALLDGRAVTASIGVAEVYPAGDFQSLYRMADGALYAAKHGGRDRVVVGDRAVRSHPSAVNDSFALTCPQAST
jgi:diguanylate cyclase (GGDEF)-like protein